MDGRAPGVRFGQSDEPGTADHEYRRDEQDDVEALVGEDGLPPLEPSAPTLAILVRRMSRSTLSGRRMGTATTSRSRRLDLTKSQRWRAKQSLVVYSRAKSAQIE